ncbi:MAG: ankyrin repeat domain-containing protein [Vicinamibacterales bacterium]
MNAFATVLTAAFFTTLASAAPADTRLVDAARQREMATVRALIGQGVDVNLPDGDGSTALHWAATHRDAEMTELLLRSGASVKAETRIGAMTPLVMAARHGSETVIRALLQAGATAGEANTNGTTALMYAAASGNAGAVLLLLDGGADANAKDVTNGQTALMFAAARNAAEAIAVLLTRGAGADVTTKVVKMEKVRVDANGDPIPAAEAEKAAAKEAAAGNKREERVLGATVVGGLTALHFAARDGQMAAVRALVDGGADVNLSSGGEKTSPMTMAIINGHMDIAKLLLDRGADVKSANIDGLTALYATIDMRWRHNTWYPQPTIEEEQTNYLDFMTALLDRGADVNARIARKLWFRKFRYGDDWVEPEGASAFWRAAQANDVAAMRLLAARSADPSLATGRGVTPLMVAAGIGFEYQGTNIAPDSRLKAVTYLVDELKVNVNAKDALDYTTLHGAAYVGDNDAVVYLVSRGADPKARAKGRLGGTQGAVAVEAGTGDSVADMANGPREKSLLHPETVKLLEGLGSFNSHDCRSTACVNNTKAEKPDKPPGR